MFTSLLSLCISLLLVHPELPNLNTFYKQTDKTDQIDTITMDLQSNDTKTITYYDSEGLLTVLSVKASALSGEKKISVSNIKYSMSYKIYIAGSSPRITNAYDPFYTFSNTVTILNSSLTVDSSYQATYTIRYKQGLLSTNKWLRVNINSGLLVVTHN